MQLGDPSGGGPTRTKGATRHRGADENKGSTGRGRGACCYVRQQAVDTTVRCFCEWVVDSRGGFDGPVSMLFPAMNQSINHLKIILKANFPSVFQ